MQPQLSLSITNSGASACTGKALSTTPVPWDRTRSSTTTCTGTRPEVTAGGASYHLGVQLGAAKSAAGGKQFVLQ